MQYFAHFPWTSTAVPDLTVAVVALSELTCVHSETVGLDCRRPLALVPRSAVGSVINAEFADWCLELEP